MIKKIFFYSLFLFFFYLDSSFAEKIFFLQNDTMPSFFNKRKITIPISAVLYGGGLIYLNQVWYKNNSSTNFRFFNDGNEWNYMDKTGHIYTSYQLGVIGNSLCKYSGYSYKISTILGGSMGSILLFPIEIMDGFSKGYGASVYDIASNATGSIMFIGQELLWKEQKILLKYSFNQTSSGNIRPKILGENFPEELIKNYNKQTYWLSFSPGMFCSYFNILPEWFNLSMGYGAENMIYGNPKQQQEAVGSSSSSSSEVIPYYQFYTSFDINFSKIPTNSSFMRSIFTVLNFYKFPFPTLEYNSRGKINFNWVY